MRIVLILCAIAALMSSCTINRITVSGHNASVINSFNNTTCEGSISIITSTACGTDIHFNGTCAAYSKWCANGRTIAALTSLGFKSVSSHTAQYQEWYKP